MDSHSKLGPGSDSREFSTVYLGNHVITPWYASSYPKRLVDEASSENNKLYICEFCFKYTVDLNSSLGHKKFCAFDSEPLGNRVHQKNQFTIYEVDGKQHPLFCQNLSLFSKMFLDTKSICYDVQSFLFYIVVETISISGRQHIVGFFSKEKKSWDDYNLACILVFPPYQRRGLGKLLIGFSYELSKMERKIGSPEKPLSDLGMQGYIAYWSYAITQALLETKKSSLSIRDLSEMTFIHPDDILVALRSMDVVFNGPRGDFVVQTKNRENKNVIDNRSSTEMT